MSSSIVMDPASASALLTDEECLLFFLRLDLSNGDVKHSTAVFGKRSNLGRSLQSPNFIRGVSRNPFDVARHCHWWATMKSEDQKKLKKNHKDLPARQRASKNKEYDSNIIYLCKKSTKDGAVFEAQINGEDIAHQAGYVLTDPLLFDYEDEDSDSDSNSDEDEAPAEDGDDAEAEIYKHIGAGSNQEDIDEYSRSLLLRVKPKTARKRMKDAPKNHAELCHSANLTAERSLFKKFGKFLDSTYVGNTNAEVAQNAPIRSALLLFVNEVRTNSNAGGHISKKIRRNKPQLIAIANNEDESKRILEHLHFYQKDKDKYDFTKITRNGHASMEEAVDEFTENISRTRSNPSKRPRSLENITNSISTSRRTARGANYRHSI